MRGVFVGFGILDLGIVLFILANLAAAAPIAAPPTPAPTIVAVFAPAIEATPTPKPTPATTLVKPFASVEVEPIKPVFGSTYFVFPAIDDGEYLSGDHSGPKPSFTNPSGSLVTLPTVLYALLVTSPTVFCV